LLPDNGATLSGYGRRAPEIGAVNGVAYQLLSHNAAFFSQRGQFLLQFLDERLDSVQAFLLIISNNGHAPMILS